MLKLTKLFPKRQFIYSFSKVLHQSAPYFIGFSLGVRDTNLFLYAIVFQMATQFLCDRLFFYAQEDIVNGNGKCKCH
mgnify:FL=1